MNMLELVVKGTDDAKAYVCGKCGQIWSAKSGDVFARETAERCCAPNVCECGATIKEQYYTACKTCCNRRDAEKEAATFEAADKISYDDYDGEMVFHDSFGNEGFCPSTDVCDELAMGEPEDRPRYAWACEPKYLVLDATDILESVLERGDHHEDAFDRLGDIVGNR